MKVLRALGICAMFASLQVNAAVIHSYANKATFLSETSATSLGTLGLSGSGQTSFTSGIATFSVQPSFSNSFHRTVDWVPGTPGNDFALNGQESFDISLTSGVRALGFDFHESGASGWTTSNFTLFLQSGGATFGTIAFTGVLDTTTFMGFYSTTLIDQVFVREDVPNLDNEYLGNFVVGTTVGARVDIGDAFCWASHSDV
jgi:hypothetical protein